MQIKFCFIVSALFLLSVSAPSHTFSGSQAYDYSNFLTRISAEEGLTQSTVTNIVKDKFGYIWIGTQMGLNRYDGYQVQSINGPNNVFEQEVISSLFTDESGNIWIGTSFSGLFKLDPATLESERVLPGKLKDSDSHYSEVLTITQQDPNTLWLGISGELYKLAIDSNTLKKVFKLPTNDDIFRALLIYDDVLLAGSSDGLYQVNLNDHSVKIVPHKPSTSNSENQQNVKLLKHLKGKGILVGTVEGLFIIPLITSSLKFEHAKLVIDKLNIWDIANIDRDYYLGTDQGLFQYFPEDSRIEFLLNYQNSKFPTNDNNIRRVFPDGSNNLWLASQSQGALKWNISTTKFNHITSDAPFSLSNENVWAIYQDRENTLWVGTDNGLNKINLEKQTNQTYFSENEIRNAEAGSYISGVYKDSLDSNKLWLVTGSGLFQFNKQTGELTPPKYNEKTKELMTTDWLGGVYVQDNENIFFFNSKGHFHYNALTGNAKKIDALNTLDVDLSFSFLGFLPNTNKVLLTTSGHLYAYDTVTEAHELVYRVRNYQPQSFNYIDSWLIDDFGTLWLAVSGEGLIGLDAKTYREKFRFDITNGLNSKYVYSLILDQNNGLWLSSQAGLHVLNLSTMHLTHFNTEDGLISTEFNGFARFYLNTGQLAFGSPSGVSIFTPNDVTKVKQLPSYDVNITNLNLMSNKEVSVHSLMDNKLTLNHDDFGLNVSFSTLEYANLDRTLYKVNLKGTNLNLNWENYQQNNLLLPKLNPGNYTLSIQARHPITGQLSKVKTIAISVAYATWASPLAKALYFLFIAAYLVFFVYSRNKRNATLQLAKQQAENNHQRMEMALTSSKSGIWEYHKTNDYLYQEKLFDELGYEVTEYCETGEDYLRLIYPPHAFKLRNKWQKFLEGKTEHWEEMYKLRSKSGQWLWYKFVGTAVKWDNDKKPTRFSGTYTNVTDAKALEEQALIFGSAFSQINDWVLILDSNLLPVTANEAFIEALNVTGNVNGHTLKPIVKKLGLDKYKKLKKALTKLQPKQIWQEEEYIQTDSSNSHPVLIKLNAITDSSERISHYVIVISDITAQKEAEEKLRHLAHYDFLTDLPNRKLLYERICQKVMVTEQSFAIMFIDLDKFKQVNDLYNHTTGDLLLKRVADKLLSLVEPHDFVARQSGDEFVILIDEYTSIESLSHLAQSIIDSLKQTIVINSLNINISSSVGIALFPEDSSGADALLQKADIAMLHAKSSGRNQFQFFTEDMNTRAHDRLKLENEIKLACDNDEFVNYYQPIVDKTQSDKVVGCELLLRWFNKEGMISPGQFIPIAEETGLIKKMTINAINQALIDFNLHFKNLEDFYISVNLSPVHIVQQGLVETLITLLKRHNLPATVLRFEITESAVLDDLEVALRKLNKLRDHGFKLLLDDFGTGYSSMTYLSRFPVQYLKIDRSFIFNIDEKVNKSIVQSVIYLADKMNLTCVAEGVETKEQLALLETLGCSLIQGFYYSKPLPINEFVKLSLLENN